MVKHMICGKHAGKFSSPHHNSPTSSNQNQCLQRKCWVGQRHNYSFATKTTHLAALGEVLGRWAWEGGHALQHTAVHCTRLAACSSTCCSSTSTRPLCTERYSVVLLLGTQGVEEHDKRTYGCTMSHYSHLNVACCIQSDLSS
jgi:hypothetical protein